MSRCNTPSSDIAGRTEYLSSRLTLYKFEQTVTDTLCLEQNNHVDEPVCQQEPTLAAVCLYFDCRQLRQQKRAFLHCIGGQ